jgi:phage gpG-like protein
MVLGLDAAIEDKGCLIRLKEMVPVTSEQMMARVGLKQIANNRDGVAKHRTQVDGSPMLESQRTKDTGDATLADKWHMLNSIKIISLGLKFVAIAPTGKQRLKAIWHQFGTKTKKGNIKMIARKWFGVRPKDLASLVKVVETWLDEQIRRLGLN